MTRTRSRLLILTVVVAGLVFGVAGCGGDGDGGGVQQGTVTRIEVSFLATPARIDSVDVRLDGGEVITAETFRDLGPDAALQQGSRVEVEETDDGWVVLAIID